MKPELFRVLDVSAPAYFILLLTGFSFATAVAVMRARRIGQNPDVIVDLALASLLMGVVGGRIFHVLFDGFFWDYVHLCTDPSLVDWPFTKVKCLQVAEAGTCSPGGTQGVWDAVKGVCHPARADCWAWARFWAGGLTYYGGLVFAAIAGMLLLKHDRFPIWKGCDLGSVGIAIGLGFGRIGCLLAGCCFGQPHEGMFSLTFPPGSAASRAQFKLEQLPSLNAWSNPVHPTQLLESLMAFAIAGYCLLYLQGRKRYDGQVFVWFLGLYGLGRFLIEFWRADDRGGALGLSTSQLIGLAIIVGAYVLHRYRVKGVAEPAPAKT